MKRTIVYRNLNIRDAVWFSIKYDGFVQGHSQSVLMLGGVEMKHASPKQAWRCRHGGKRKKGCREVCAWLKAPVVVRDCSKTEPQPGWKRMACDPKKVDGFCDAETGKLIDECEAVHLTTQGAYYQ